MSEVQKERDFAADVDAGYAVEGRTEGLAGI
jgi:hypothetical protein